MERQRIELCRVDELAPGSSRGFSVTLDDSPLELFVVRTARGLYGYRNSCPHTGSPLDWVPDRFLSTDGSRIQCATHHALFRIEDGVCTHGPCAGESLAPLRLDVDDGRVWLVAGNSGGQ